MDYRNIAVNKTAGHFTSGTPGRFMVSATPIIPLLRYSNIPPFRRTAPVIR